MSTPSIESLSRAAEQAERQQIQIRADIAAQRRVVKQRREELAKAITAWQAGFAPRDHTSLVREMVSADMARKRFLNDHPNATDFGLQLRDALKLPWSTSDKAVSAAAKAAPPETKAIVDYIVTQHTRAAPKSVIDQQAQYMRNTTGSAWHRGARSVRGGRVPSMR